MELGEVGVVQALVCLERASSSSSSSSSSSRVVPIRDNESTTLNAQQQFQTRTTPLLGLLRLQHAHSSRKHDHDHDHPSTTLNLEDDDATTINISDQTHKHKHDQDQDQDDWLPITQSRKGNSLTAAFHLLCSGFGIQSLLLPVAFIPLGWMWGTVCMSLAFAWQLYTTWLLVHLHQPCITIRGAQRYSRYVVLSITAFGPKLGKLLAIFPTMYLSGGTCVLFIINGGGIMDLLSKLSCGHDAAACNADKLLTGAQWFLVFVCLAVLVSQFFPTLNSLAPVSLVGSVAAVVYFTLLWTLSIISKGGRQEGDELFYGPPKHAASEVAVIRGIIDALGIIALTFRGHNLVLEIQGTMPTSPQHPARNLMWKGVKTSYVVIALCLFPLAVGGYWSYGSAMATNGILNPFSEFHFQKTSKYTMGTIYVMFLIHLICAFQIYGMPVFDNLERIYVSKKNQACPRWLRSAIRVFFGGLTYFIAVAFPFLGSLGPFIGATTLPLTLSYPCFMWIAIKKPRSGSIMWSLNLGLGSLGIVMSSLMAAAALWNLVAKGLDANFFKPH